MSIGYFASTCPFPILRNSLSDTGEFCLRYRVLLLYATQVELSSNTLHLHSRAAAQTPLHKMYTFVYRTFIKFILFCRGQALFSLGSRSHFCRGQALFLLYFLLGTGTVCLVLLLSLLCAKCILLFIELL